MITNYSLNYESSNHVALFLIMYAYVHMCASAYTHNHHLQEQINVEKFKDRIHR